MERKSREDGFPRHGRIGGRLNGGKNGASDTRRKARIPTGIISMNSQVSSSAEIVAKTTEARVTLMQMEKRSDTGGVGTPVAILPSRIAL